MPRLPLTLSIAVLIAIAGLSPTHGEVLIERSLERMTPMDRDAYPKPTTGGLSGQADTDKGLVGGRFFVPFLVDDTTPGGTSTFISVRHAVDSDDTIDINIVYASADFSAELASELVTLKRDQLISRNLKLVPGVVNPGGTRRGFLFIDAPDDVTADFFQLDDDGNFATGDRSPSLFEFCNDFKVRFLRFGVDDTEGSKLTFIVDGPMGGDLSDPPTIQGEVFDEGGNFLNSFTIRTNDFTFEALAATMAIGSDFGTMRITINSQFSAGGMVFVAHSAFGRFSVGTPARCRQQIF